MRYQSKGDYLTAVAPSQERELKLASNHEPKLRNQVAPSQERELKSTNGAAPLTPSQVAPSQERELKSGS